MPRRAQTTAMTVVFALAFLPGCGLFDVETGLACQEPPEGNWQLTDQDIPDVSGMRPRQAAAAFDRADLDVSWRYSYDTEEGGRVGYSECWCIAPPDGTVDWTATSDAGWLIVNVTRSDPMPGGRPQPRAGWGCDEGT
jgi:hypothetical protein